MAFEFYACWKMRILHFGETLRKRSHLWPMKPSWGTGFLAATKTQEKIYRICCCTRTKHWESTTCKSLSRKLENRVAKHLLYLQAPVLGDTSPCDDVLSSVRWPALPRCSYSVDCSLQNQALKIHEIYWPWFFNNTAGIRGGISIE